MYAYTHEYTGVGIWIHLNNLVVELLSGCWCWDHHSILSSYIQLCTCARPVMEPWYYGRYYGCLRGWWSQYWIVIIDYDHWLLNSLMALVLHLINLLIGSEKMDSAPLKYFTSSTWNSLLQINHVNPCRVPKKSVVILLCVCSIIYIQEIGIVILLLYKKYNEE